MSIVLAQLEARECVGELFLNGVPVVRIAPDNVPIANVAAEQYLVPGTNRLEILLEPGPTPRTARTAYREIDFRPMRAAGRLIRFDAEGVPGLAEYGQVLGETTFVWDPQTRPERRSFPIAVETQLELGAAHGRWAWQDAPPLTLDDALLREIDALLREIEDTFRRGDKAAYARLIDAKVKDLGRAYPNLPPGALQREVDALFKFAGGSPDPVLPRDPSAEEYRLVAQDRMIELVDRDFRASLKLRDPDNGTANPHGLLVARLNGILVVVR
jgi:hypothetical protein